jgi:hypothetical protein
MNSQPAHASAIPVSPRHGGTQWSLVFNGAGAGATAPAQEALAELCLRYGYPVYAYLRRCGHAAFPSAGVLHGFFHHLSAPRAREGGLPGSFRRWLLDELHGFLTQPERFDELLTVVRLPPAELERRYASAADAGGAPEAVFRGDFAREVLIRAQQRLESEAAQAGRQVLYDHLAPLLSREAAQGQFEALAQVLDSRPLALVTAVKRLRQRFREPVDAELSETVAGGDDLVSERLAWRAALDPA